MGLDPSPALMLQKERHVWITSLICIIGVVGYRVLLRELPFWIIQPA